MLQGAAAALLVPGALALIQASFRPEDRPAAIGTWAGLAGVATAVGPLIGGFLVDHAGWRWIFAINLPLCALVVLMGVRAPESRDTTATGRFDVAGALAGAVALGVSTYLLTAWPTLHRAVIVAGVLVAFAAIAAFGVLELRPHAMAPLSMFRSRVFSAANMMTFLVYGALGSVLFFLVLQLLVTVGYGAIAAGLATVPIALVMLLLSRAPRCSPPASVPGSR